MTPDKPDTDQQLRTHDSTANLDERTSDDTKK